MPIDAQHGTPNRFLQVLAHPPIALLVKGAYADCAGTGATGKLVFVGGPADKGCGTVETEEDERGFPGSVGLSLPDIGIALQDTSGGRSSVVRSTSCEQVTMRLDLGAQSTLVTSLSCCNS
jgi:hypothetical protein